VVGWATPPHYVVFNRHGIYPKCSPWYTELDHELRIRAWSPASSGANKKGGPLSRPLRSFELETYRTCTFSACQPLGPLTTLNETA
jgi:hypothetical protein